MNKKLKILLLLLAIVIFTALCYAIIKLVKIDDLSTFKSIINDNIWGAIIYVVILSLQIVFIPINSLILIVPAIMVFGAIKAFVLSFISLLIGSCISYYIGKFFGVSILKFFAGTKSVNKIQNTLSKNGKIMLPFLLLVPIFPDELICMLAGIARLNFAYFFVVSFFTRLIDLFCTCFIGAIIPMHGWWLLLWLGLAILGIIIAVWLGKNQEKLQNKFLKFINKIFAKRWQ